MAAHLPGVCAARHVVQVLQRDLSQDGLGGSGGLGAGAAATAGAAAAGVGALSGRERTWPPRSPSWQENETAPGLARPPGRPARQTGPRLYPPRCVPASLMHIPARLPMSCGWQQPLALRCAAAPGTRTTPNLPLQAHLSSRMTGPPSALTPLTRATLAPNSSSTTSSPCAGGAATSRRLRCSCRQPCRAAAVFRNLPARSLPAGRSVSHGSQPAQGQGAAPCSVGCRGAGHTRRRTLTATTYGTDTAPRLDTPFRLGPPVALISALVRMSISRQASSAASASSARAAGTALALGAEEPPPSTADSAAPPAATMTAPPTSSS